METTVTTDLIERLLKTIFGSNWTLSKETVSLGFSDDRKRKLFIRIELIKNNVLINFAEGECIINEAKEGGIEAQMITVLSQMKNNPEVLSKPMN